MRNRLEMEVKVGLFVAIGLGLIMFAIILLGDTDKLFSKRAFFHSFVGSAEELIPGAKVITNGVRVGAVEDVSYEDKKGQIRITYSVNQKYLGMIHQGAVMEITTQGVLGDKFVSISGAESNEAPLSPGSEIPTKAPAGLKTFLTEGEQLLGSLNSIAKNLDQLLFTFKKGNRNEILAEGLTNTARNLAAATGKLNTEIENIQIKKAVTTLNSILTKIDNGNGTLGALINDPALYDDVKSLVGGANNNRIVRNLVRKTIKDSESKTK